MLNKVKQDESGTLLASGLTAHLDEPLISNESEKFVVLAEHVPVGLILIDRFGKIKCINEKFKAIFGYDIEDIPDGKTWFRTVYPDPEYRHKIISTWIEDLGNFLKLKDLGERKPYTFTVVCKNSAQKIINFIPVQLPDGDTLMGCEDITELMAVEDELRKERSTFLAILENHPFGVALVDHSGAYRYVNPQFTEIMGYTLHDVPTGRDFLNRAYPDEEYRKTIMDAWKKGKVPGTEAKPAENWVVCKDGTKKAISYKITHVKDFSIIVLNDVTDHKQAECALERNEEKYRSIYENAIEGIFQLTPDGHFLSTNPSHVKMLGYDSADELIQNVTDIKKQLFVNEQDHRKFKKLLEKNNICEKFETRLYHKDGSVIWVSLNARTAKNDEGEIMYYEGTTENITRRKIVEKEKLELEARLRQSVKMEAIGKFAGGIAHDFNNILVVLLGHASLLKAKINDDALVYSHIDKIVDAIEKASSFTKSLLAFSRNQDIALQPVPIGSVIRKTKSILEGLLPPNVNLKILLDDEELMILADISKIHQVLMNLVTNARDAMPKGGKINIESKKITPDKTFRDLHGYDKSADYVLLAVADTGNGINDGAKDRIFEPFYTTKKHGKGTGLGLSIVYGIVKQHNGHISVSSEPNKGTTFNIYFPIIKTEKLEELAGTFLP